MNTHDTSTRAHIAREVRVLRRERAWTQAELARKLGLSQSYLSEIENGGGSFTAEQFLLILKLFNVTVTRFVADDVRGWESQLQNALARLGAHHLRESEEVVPDESLDDVTRVVCDVVSNGDPRLTAALAPVLVSNIDRIPLAKLHLDLTRAGLERRLPWLCENTTQALLHELGSHAKASTDVPRSWLRQAHRAAVVLGHFVDAADRTRQASPSLLEDWDFLDPSIRSEKTVDEVWKAGSPISQKWRIVTSLTPEDFNYALRAARVGHP